MKILRKIKGKRITLQLYEILEKPMPMLYYKIMLNGKFPVKIGECSAKLGMNEYFYYIGNTGYSIEEPWRGNGYAGEAVELLKIVFIKNKMHKIIITNDPSNHESIRVCEKLGCKLKEVVKVPEGHELLSQGHTHENIWILEF